MDFLKALFEKGAITWEQFEAAVAEKGYKIADLSTGNYVSKKKYDDELATANTTITDLKGQIATRDTDLTKMKEDLEAASNSGKDNATTIADLQSQINKWQEDYATAKTDFETKLASQQYEFAAKEFANTKKFTSSAAKREFEKQLISANLKMQDNIILGADDFTNEYMKTNSDSFVVENPNPPAPQDGQKPTFVQPTPPTTPPDSNPFDFGFIGVREH